MFRRGLSYLMKLPFSTLTVQQAAARTKLVKSNSINYYSYLVLHKGERYEGYTNITFQTLGDPQSQDSLEDLKVDFQGKSLKGLMVNGHIVQRPQTYHRQGSIIIPSNLLRIGEVNHVAVRYENIYDQDGNGCVSFIDTDQKQYLYTQFEPYFASRVFPLLDQPDLKAPLELTIACPSDWQAVLSNQFEVTSPQGISTVSLAANIIQPYYQKYKSFSAMFEASVPEDYKVSAFRPTLPISTYLYCFVVGAYKEMEINLKPKNKALQIPMRLYCIESLYPQMVKLAPYIEEITVESMDFFQKYFGHRYPFSKYDQVFAHEYKWGAMENAGIVTFNDGYLFKDKVSNEKMLSFGNTIVHQLSHHWFGNLVTMKWWDDLWLNQSFAEYISHFCLQKIKGNLKTISYESAMLSFFSRKVWGYSEDELATTHPIRSPVQDTQTAESIFDGITYSKGAATMKQLMYLIGQDAFSKALTAYFHKHAFGNAVLDDLLASMKPHFTKSNHGFTLDKWKKMWLQTAGTNILSCNWVPGQHETTIFQRHDRAECETLRLHRMEIAIILKDHSIITKQVTVLPEEQTKVVLQIPQNAVALLLNHNDHTFTKVQIDQRSRQYFENNLSKFKNSVGRSMIWKAYFDMVKDTKITSVEFVRFCIKNLQYEDSDPIFEDQLNKLYSAISLYTPKIYRGELYFQIFCFLEELLVSLPEDLSHSNRKVIIREKLIDFCHNERHVEVLHDWYKGNSDRMTNEELNNSLRWKIVLKLFSRQELSEAEKWKLFDDMKSRDSSDVMINRKFTCQALATPSQKLDALYATFFKKQPKRSLTNFVYQLRGFNNEIHYQAIRTQFCTKYFQDLSRLLRDNPSEQQKWFVQGDFLESFLVHADPILERDVKDLERKKDGFKGLTTSNEKIKRTILKMIDMLERRIRVYQRFEEAKE